MISTADFPNYKCNDLQSPDIFEKYVKVGEQTVLFMPSFWCCLKLQQVSSPVNFKDYEYASYNPAAYDLANHFCEMAANYHSETPHILDYNFYPGLEERERFVRSYLSSTVPADMHSCRPAYSVVKEKHQHRL
ncbi:hypothetical protein POM88_025418 [Heracleum sosnowskyi]|uniref:Uncharacterized protein n=1 Tax=Heracleum sosnowskyi TaxID=360622 RepID=A0AAD8I590_9APIA|nr:hypothetical protein POM88_025418 [Heracleum sosnowskyi]